MKRRVPLSFSSRLPDEPTIDTADFLSGGGEMGQRMRAFDWSKTGLGSPRSWPQSLKTIVRVMLDSRYAMWMLWGPDLTFFCNDAYLPTVGLRRDWVLGARADKVWEEIWPEVAPRIERVLNQGEATWDEALLLFLERSGFTEETFHTFSYSPVYDDQSRIAGMLCVVTEVTERVIGERRLRVLRDLAAQAAGIDSVAEACRRLVTVLADNPADVPFASLYLIDESRTHVELAASHGAMPSRMRPQRVRLDEPDGPWPLAGAIRSGEPQLVALPGEADAITGSLWPDRIARAIVLPIQGQGSPSAAAALIAGISPRRPLDDNYRAFYELIARQCAAALAGAQAYEAERRRAAGLAELDRAKTLFFSNVSHEFRTPLTLLLGPLEAAVADPTAAAPLRAQLELAQRNALRLLKLVNSLLDFSRLEAGRADACFEPTDAAALTRDLASSFRSAVERAGMRFEVQCEPLAEPVFLDREMWEKIVLNLLSNAFKFTLEGGISVRLRRVGARAVLTVADSGIGIPEHEIPRLFERFHRVEGARGRTHEGSGIGLALVHELVRMHGGRIVVRSSAPGGTTFEVSLPLGSAHLPAERIRQPRVLASTASGAQAYVQEALRWLPDAAVDASLPPTAEHEGAAELRAGARATRAQVLLADDNADMRGYVRAMLAPYYEVEAVADGEQALESVRRHRPDLIVSDVMMPRLDGFELLRALRADEALRDIPCILLSARAGEESRIEGLDAGADDYLVKPFSSRELLARVGASLTLARVRRELQRKIADDLEAMTRLRTLGDRCASAAADAFPQCLEAILETALFITGADRGTLQLFDPASQTLRIAAQRGFEHRFLERFGSIGGGDSTVCARALTVAERVIVEDVLDSELITTPSARETLIEAGVRSVQSTPILSSTGRTLGMISTHNSQPQRPDERSLRLLDLLVRQAASYLERRHADEILRASQALLASQNAALQSADRHKDEFLAMLAHELRNPLAPIRNAIELLTRSQSMEDPRAQAAVAVSRRQLAQLTRLVDDLLDVSRITRGHIELKRRPLELSAVITGALETVQPLLREKHHEVSVESVGYPPLHVSADAARLTQCIVNVLNNAAKYTDPGGRIRIQCRAQEGVAVLEIADSGAGISPELLPRVFDLFVQGDRTLDRTQGGLGIGLSVVRQLIELHGGTVVARSAGVGQGASFEIRLPLVPSPAATPTSEPSVSTTATRILVVDDNRDSADSLTWLLELEGHEVKAVYGAREALELAERYRPALVLLDIGLPGMDGYDLAQRLRAMPALEGTRLVAVTGYGRTEDRRRAHCAGFDEHLIKPLDLPHLHRILAAATRTRA